MNSVTTESSTVTQRPPEIEDIYPLSPMQEGMLFHTLAAPDSGVYVTQMSCTLHGALDIEAFTQAWRAVMARHAVLRTAFVWEDLDQLVQVVCRVDTVPLTTWDWRALPPAKQQAQLAHFLATDRSQNFEMNQAPLMRLTLIRLTDDRQRFIWSHHHILLDGWSMPLLIGEVLTSYAALHRGQALQMPPLRPYRDYIAWLLKQDKRKAEAFWRGQLQGFTTPTPLSIASPTGRSHEPAEQRGEQEIALPQALTNQLRTLAQQQGLTLNTLIQAAWGLLLSRYSGEQDVIFGAVVSGRPAALRGVESMVGLFVNALPVRVQAPAAALLLPWLKALQAQQAATMQYESTPLVQIQKWSDVPPGLPLFESIYAFENYPKAPPTAAAGNDIGVQVEEYQVVDQDNYPLTLAVEQADTLMISLYYDSRRFDGAATARMLQHLQTLLAHFVTNPAQRLADLALITAEERQQLLETWNQTATPAIETSCVHERVAAQAAQHAQKVAVVWRHEQLTYQALNEQANQLAHHLQRLGVGPEVLVAVYMERTPQMVVAKLGVLKAGGAYIPLDPAHPSERVAFMVNDAGTTVLLTESHLAAMLPPLTAKTICLDRAWEQIATESSVNPVSAVTPLHRAYVIYTSGSTGVPKGVEIEHAGLSNLINWHQQSYQIIPADRATQLASLAFDASVWELWPYLTAGASIHLPPDETTRLSIGSLVEWLTNEAITISFLPTPLAEALLDEPWPAENTLRLLLTGGDRLHRPPHPQTSFTLINHYGPTEYTVVTTAVPVEQGEATTLPPIGRPIANTQLYILDPNQQPVPIGVPGELYIGGNGLARGYLHRPDLTAERFVPDPFSGQSGARLYRTGDLVSYLPDGNVEFLGRIDHQVKIRGYRIELGEIESVLGCHPAVAETAVVAQEDSLGTKRLVAYIVLRPSVAAIPLSTPSSNGAAPNGNRTHHTDIPTGDEADQALESELHSFLRTTLPDYMVPAAFIRLETLPLTPNGKIDRKALAAAPSRARWSRPTLSNQFVAPRTDNEQELATIWRKVLGVEEVGIHDNFFELGGDSIRSIQVISKANQAGLHLTTTQLFQNPTIAQLVTKLGEAAPTTAEEVTVAELLPLTPIQHWFFAQGHPDPHHWNWSFLYEITLRLDVDLLADALQLLLAHHDALRLCFQTTALGWQQRVADLEDSPPLTVIDLSMVPPAQLRRAIEAAAARLQTTLNLAEGPLLRMIYFACGARQPDRLMVIFHHLIVDPVSVHYLWDDLQTVYEQLLRRDAPQLPPKTTSFQQWVQRLAAHAQSQAVRDELSYWVSRLQAGADSTIPLDHPGGVNRQDSAAIHLVALDEHNTRLLLQAIPAACGVQINEVLLTALVRLYAGWIGKQKLLVNLMGHGREELFADIDVSRTVGWFVNIYPVLVDLGDTPAAVDALLATREQLRAVPQRGMGYGLLRYLCDDDAVRRQMNRLPSAEIAFNYQGQWDLDSASAALPLREADEEMGPQRSREGMREHVLTIETRVVGRQLYLNWHYSQNLHDRTTIEALAQRHLEEVQALIEAVLTTDPPGAGTSRLDRSSGAKLMSRQPA